VEIRCAGVRCAAHPGKATPQISLDARAVWVNGNWRMTFMFEGENVVLVDYQDYH